MQIMNAIVRGRVAFHDQEEQNKFIAELSEGSCLHEHLIFNRLFVLLGVHGDADMLLPDKVRDLIIGRVESIGYDSRGWFINIRPIEHNMPKTPNQFMCKCVEPYYPLFYADGGIGFFSANDKSYGGGDSGDT